MLCIYTFFYAATVHNFVNLQSSQAEREMSKRKHNIAYVKPEEPKFLRELKLQAGFKEGPTIDTKHEDLPEAEDGEDIDEEEPVVVILKEGDLTAEEADAIKKQKEDEEANAKADLTKRVIFRNNKADTAPEDPATKRIKKTKRKKVPLSFNDDEDD